ncbi:uncharacterized protein PV06_08333 [Exophiala oligosperma]|uniref:Uncharacterized protein n=1 Tax=Exophiala oligosperma TaxID=215243 RepID=A0A0D2BQE3_9EURO|nr:uncharacterized protein PV06_08333 [Exophiala oligosperma]KIW39747.1 hypothetical protein PV06_08333 [Exophiala oligosperma]
MLQCCIQSVVLPITECAATVAAAQCEANNKPQTALYTYEGYIQLLSFLLPTTELLAMSMLEARSRHTQSEASKLHPQLHHCRTISPLLLLSQTALLCRMLPKAKPTLHFVSMDCIPTSLALDFVVPPDHRAVR